jgi:glycosyltransferase involved in cell wall biosynthesis
MRICIVNSFYPPWIGGAETYVSNLARCLVKRGHDVTVYCAHNPLPVGETFEEGVRVRRMRAPIRLYGTPIAVSPLNLFSEDYDVIHCNFPSPYLAALFAFLSRVRGIPAVLTWHNDLPPVTSAAGVLVRIHDLFAPLYLSQYQKIIATTPTYARNSRILQSRPEKVVVISNGVDTARFNPWVDGEPIRELHGLSGKKVVLFVGALTRWHAYKGLDNLIRAFSITREKVHDSHLVVVGSGELAEYNRKLAESLGIEGNVTFAGGVSEELLPQYYAACDLFVLASRDNSEGYGLALLEAMATGKPAIGSRVGGIVDVINDEETGLLVEPNQPDELAKAMIRLFQDDELRHRMGIQARQFAEKHDWSETVRLVEAVYREAIAHS